MKYGLIVLMVLALQVSAKTEIINNPTDTYLLVNERCVQAAISTVKELNKRKFSKEPSYIEFLEVDYNSNILDSFEFIMEADGKIYSIVTVLENSIIKNPRCVFDERSSSF